MDKALLQVLEYYSVFHYAPTIEEIIKFSRVKMKAPNLAGSKTVVVQSNRVTVAKNKGWIRLSVMRHKISESKIEKCRWAIQLLGKLPWVKLIGISGSVAAMNAQEQDDVDLFVIASKNRLWTARFFLTVVSVLMGKRRNRTDRTYRNKLCFNLFFTEDDLKVPLNKQNAYTAHEVLQVIPIVDKEETHQKFLEANRWVEKVFPNVHGVIASSLASWRTTKPAYRQGRQSNIRSGLLHFVRNDYGLFFENIFKRIQMYIISRHQTRELITKTQLWFFPDDFALKIPKRMIYS